MITVKIDITKIDKSKLFEGKNGAKYLDVILWEVSDDKYGNDYRAVQSVSSQDRANGVRGAILGSAKILKRSEPASRPAPSNPKEHTSKGADDLPF